MGAVGAIIGGIVGLFIGLFVSSLLLGGGRHLAARENPNIKLWVGMLIWLIAIGGGCIGFMLAT